MDPQINSAIPVSQVGAQSLQKEIAASRAMQIETRAEVNQYFDLIAFNPLQDAQKFKTLKEILEEKKVEEKKQETSTSKVDEAATRFQKRNHELNARTLKILRAQIAAQDTADEILQKVQAIYQDEALADEALEFLAEVSESELLAATLEAKEKLNKDKSKEIRAGRNMGAQAREFSEKGLGSPTRLRDLYRDLILNQREPLKLFEELADQFEYEKLKKIIAFLLRSLGADLKSKGPSIARGELKRLLDETRSMQGILGVFRFFQSRMRIIHKEFASYHLPTYENLTFEWLSRVFVKVLAERFLNPEKLAQLSKILGIANQPAAQLVIYSQMCDAVKQISPRYFKDPKHKDALLKAFFDTMEKLEDLLEEEEEKK